LLGAYLFEGFGQGLGGFLRQTLGGELYEHCGGCAGFYSAYVDVFAHVFFVVSFVGDWVQVYLNCVLFRILLILNIAFLLLFYHIKHIFILFSTFLHCPIKYLLLLVKSND
jgi:hypothetical protein